MTKYSDEMKVTKEIGVNVNTVCRWVNDYRKKHNMPSYASEDGIKERIPKDEEELRARVKQLERQLKDKERELYFYATTRMKYEAISLKSNEFPVRKMCEALGL